MPASMRAIKTKDTISSLTECTLLCVGVRVMVEMVVEMFFNYNFT